MSYLAGPAPRKCRGCQVLRRRLHDRMAMVVSYAMPEHLMQHSSPHAKQVLCKRLDSESQAYRACWMGI